MQNNYLTFTFLIVNIRLETQKNIIEIYLYVFELTCIW